MVKPSETWTDPRSGISMTPSDDVGAAFATAMVDALHADEVLLQAWGRELVAHGVGIAHPDDGWVDRCASTVGFCYPFLQAWAPYPGAWVALGGPGRWRLVELHEHLVGPFHRFMGQTGPWDARWSFREVSKDRVGWPAPTPAQVVPQRPQRRWWEWRRR